MAIIRKDHIAFYLRELDDYYQQLRAAIEGQQPSPNISHDYHCESDQFAREYADVDLDRVEQYIRHFRIPVEALKTLKKRVAKPVGR